MILDPPYGLKINKKIIDYLYENHMLNNGCIIVLEDLNEEAFDIEIPFILKREISYGITTLQILKYEE